MRLSTLTMLTVPEYLKYIKIIPKTDDAWWLKSPADGEPSFVKYVTRDGRIKDMYCSDICNVRPAGVFNFDIYDASYWGKPEKLVGSEIKYSNHMWTILDIVDSRVYALCNDFIYKCCFDSDNNNWLTSELWNVIKAKERILRVVQEQIEFYSSKGA